MFYSTSTFRVEGRRYRVIGATRQKYGQPSLRRARQEKDKLKTFYSAIKKKKKKECNHATGSHMDGPRDYRTKWNEADRERQILYDFTHMWNVKYDPKELICEAQTGSRP